MKPCPTCPPPSAPESGVRLHLRQARVVTRRELESTVCLPVEPYDRPVTRGDCVGGPRPCPFVGCRFNLYLDVTKGGGIRFNFPGYEVDEMPGPSCALDVADAGDHTLEEVGDTMQVTRERVRQLEEGALRQLRRRGVPR